MNVNFSYSNKMVLDLLKIEQNRCIIYNCEIKREDQEFLNSQAIINSAFYACKADDDTINADNITEKVEVKNYMNLLGNFNNYPDIYSNLFIIFNNQLTKNLFTEEFDFKVSISKIDEIVSFIDEENLPLIIKIGIVHYNLNKLSAFRHMEDKTIKAIDSYLLYLKGFDLNQYINLNEYFYLNKEKYQEALNEDLTTWLNFFTTAMLEVTNSFKQIIISLGSDFDLSEKELRIIEYLEENSCIQNRHVQEILDISAKTSHSYLDRLLKKNIIARHGHGRSIHYKLKRK